MAKQLKRVIKKTSNRKVKPKRTRRQGTLKARLQELRILQEIGQAVLTSPDLKTTQERILDKAVSVGRFDIGTILLWKGGDGSPEIVAGRGYRGPSHLYKRRGETSGERQQYQGLRSNEPVVVADLSKEKGLRALKEEGVRSAILIPVHGGEQVLGVIQLGSRRWRKFQSKEVRLLKDLGSQIGIAVQRARLNEETQKSLDRVCALREIGLAASSTLDLHAVLDVLMKKIDLFLPHTAVQVWLLNRETGFLERTVCSNLDAVGWKGREMERTPPLIREAFEGKMPVTIVNIQADPRVLDPQFFRGHGLVSYLGVPMLVKDQPLGVLVFHTRELHEFTKEEIRFFSTLAGQAAIAIHNSQLHEQTVKQASELEKANKVKDEFLGFVSHELRTPLNAVIAYTLMMQDKLLGEINPEQEQTLEKMLGSSKDLLGMINSLLELTRIQAGKVEVENHRVDLVRFLEDLKSIYDVPTGKALVLSWDFPSDLPAVKTDSGKLRHILQNLINNATKFTEKGMVKVSARSCSGTGRMEFKVEDTGIGIPQESLPAIFEMFRQVNGSAGKSGGVGLGLHIVKKFTEMLGGEIAVESEVGKGSTFTFTIPRNG